MSINTHFLTINGLVSSLFNLKLFFMKLDATTGSIITEERARKLITSFAIKYKDEINSSFIGSENVQHILNQEGCVGLRIYNGYDEENKKMNLVLVGVDESGKEMLQDGIIYDELALCPPTCPIDLSLLKK
ncbi:MAG: hypothetical protein MUF43_07735 [Flavobacterium sp.]|nr:hypothetical protein [Flavobacterium sp.]